MGACAGFNLSPPHAPILVFSSLFHCLHRPHYPERRGLTPLVKHFQLLRMLSDWMKLYNGEQRCGITAESALFVCNKWDEVEKQTNQTQREDLQKHIIGKLRKKIPDLDERSQLIKMSVLRAAEVQKKFHVMSDDLNCLINGLQRLLPLCIERKTEYLYW